MQRVQLGCLSWLWGSRVAQSQKVEDVRSSSCVSGPCVFDVNQKSLSFAYAKALHEAFRRIQILLVSGRSVQGAIDEIKALMDEDVPMDAEVQSWVTLLEVRLMLIESTLTRP